MSSAKIKEKLSFSIKTKQSHKIQIHQPNSNPSAKFKSISQIQSNKSNSKQLANFLYNFSAFSAKSKKIQSNQTKFPLINKSYAGKKTQICRYSCLYI
jgi:hypothetical protein